MMPKIIYHVYNLTKFKKKQMKPIPLSNTKINKKGSNPPPPPSQLRMGKRTSIRSIN
jgi:hypothetical protein